MEEQDLKKRIDSSTPPFTTSISQDTQLTPPSFPLFRQVLNNNTQQTPPILDNTRKTKELDGKTNIERINRRVTLTAQGFGFKSLSPQPSPNNSDSEDGDEHNKKNKIIKHHIPSSSSSSLAVVGGKRVKTLDALYFNKDQLIQSTTAMAASNKKRKFMAKRFKDQVYGHIELPACCITVMDTPQFQRLRNLKQLGAAYFVFPGASHNRFEHSLGVSWLAGVLMKRLSEVHPELKISSTDIELVQLAGLVHDLGHGPYSHMFDGQFIPRTRQDLKGKYSHEEMTVRILDELISSNSIDLKDFDLDPVKDLLFIKETILGKSLPGGISKRKGRGKEKWFMYDVINNVSSGMDVDRLDYYERDARNTCVKSGCDVQRLIAESRVCMVDSIPRVVFPDKLVGDVLAAFQTRFRLHHAVYQHKVVKAIELMIVDALVAADEANVFSFRGNEKKDFSLKHSIDDPVAFCLAQDDVLNQIRSSRTIEAYGARALLKRLDTRNLYRSVGEVSIRRPTQKEQYDYHYNEEIHGPNGNSLSQIERNNDQLHILFDRPESEIKELLLSTDAAKLVDLSPSDVIVEKMRVHHGSYADNPVDSVYFYSKSAPNHARILHRSKYENLCPATFQKEAIRVFCTSTSENILAAVHDSFRELIGQRPFLSTNATPLHTNSLSSSDDDNEDDDNLIETGQNDSADEEI